MILSKVKARIRRTTHKYEIEILNSIENDNHIDKTNGNNFWRDELAKEMTNIGIAFEVLEEGQ